MLWFSRKTSVDRIGLLTWLSLIFLQPFAHFGGLRILCVYILLFCLLAGLRINRHAPSMRMLSPKLAAAVALWAIVVSLTGPFPIDSFHALRKDLLVQAVMLLGALLYIRTPNDAWQALQASIAGFSVLTVLALGEIGLYWANNGFALWVPRSHDSFWGGYAATASLFIPLLTGWLLTAPKSKTLSIAGWLLLPIAAFLVFIYGSRTPLLVIGVATLLLFILLKKWRSLTVATIGAVLIGTLIQLAPLGHMDKYRSLLKGETYVTDEGLSQRFSVWKGCWEVISERPITGYGYGWKKLAWVINEQGFAERWQSKHPDIAAYFLAEGKASYGKVNPHNYFLQVMFEIGSIGLGLVLLFWLSAIRESLPLMRDKRYQSLASCLLSGIAAYALTNLTNGQWVGNFANITLVLIGCLLTLSSSVQAEKLAQQAPQVKTSSV